MIAIRGCGFVVNDQQMGTSGHVELSTPARSAAAAAGSAMEARLRIASHREIVFYVNGAAMPRRRCAPR